MRTRIIFVLGCAMALAFLPSARSADDASPEPAADVVCKLDSGSGTLTASSGPGGTLLSVTSPGFSGNATYTFGAATPPRMKFRFVGTPLMRTFRISDGKNSYSSQLLDTGGKTTTYHDRLGGVVTDPALASVTLTVEATKAGDIEVSVSTVRGVELGKELKVHWVQNNVLKRR